MKRPHTNFPSSGIGTGRDIRESITKEQLAGIGAVTLAYNYAEHTIDRMMAPAIGVRTANMYENIATRINGVDGKIAIVKFGAKEMDVAPEIQIFLSESLGDAGFGLFKKYRDAVIHARILNEDLGIGELLEKRGRRAEVLLTAEALEALYQHINAMRMELACLLGILIDSMVLYRTPDDPENKQREQEIQAYFAQARQYRTRRLSLRPIPEFPAEPQLSGPENQGPPAPQEELTAWHERAEQPDQEKGC